MRTQRAVIRADRILDAVARSAEPLSLSEIARSIGAPVSSVQELIDDLRHCGYLLRSGRGYSLGQRLFALSVIDARRGEPPLSSAELVELSTEIGASVALAMLVGPELIYVDHVGSGPVDIEQPATDHLPRPLLSAAAGRLLLAFVPDDERMKLLAAHTSPAEIPAYLDEMADIRRHRLAYSDGRVHPGIRVAAVPVMRDGVVTAAVVIVSRRTADGGQVALRHAARRAKVWLRSRGHY